MGLAASYLSRPNKTKVSEDHQSKKLVYGVSSMQGWRRKQEDAHNCILDFDEETSLFAVYDGHGGAEVAVYTSEKLPEFIKDTEDYKKGNYKEALISAFLDFDDSLRSRTVVAQLKKIMAAEKSDDSDQEESGTILHVERPQCSHSDENGDEDDADYEYGDIGDPETETPDSLRRDANRPLEEVIASYQSSNVSKLISGERVNPLPPSLRGRREGASSSGECSSSFSGECSSSFVKPGSSSTNECTSSSSTDAEKSDATGSGDVEAKSSSNGDAEESSSSAIPKEQSEEVTESVKSSKDESLKNGPSNEALVNGSANSVNGGATEVAEVAPKQEQKVCEKPNKGSPAKSEEKPSCSTPSKKKLALTDLDDSDVVKNFITKEEISEDDEDDSEDETFQLDDGLENESDDDEEEEDVGESLLSKLKRRLCQAAMAAAEEDDDDDDDDEEHVPTSSEPNDEGEDEEDEADVEEGEEEEDSFESSGDEEDDEDDSAISLFTDDSNTPGVGSGCTAVVALVKNNNLFVANAGDSRCVLCKGGVAVDMSEDHKPEDDLERTRITKAGGVVNRDGRVNDGLNLSRAIGDHEYKRNTDLPNTEQMIIALPDVRVCKLDPDVEFIVLACDGIWNSMTSQEVVDFVRPKIQADQKLSSICEELFEKCLAPNTLSDGTGCDNMTCIIVKPLHDENETCEKVQVEIKTSASSSAEVDSLSNVVSHSEQIEVDNEAVPSAEGTESQATESEKAVSDASLSSTSQKRCADSTEDDECQAKKQKTDKNNESS